MSDRRKLLVALGLGMLSAAIPTLAQPPARVRRIGFLATRSRSTPATPDVYYDTFVQGMRELGYIEGNNLVIEWRFADGKYERLPALAAELVQMNVELIVTSGTPDTIAAQRASRTIPIVMTTSGDPVGSGFAKGLARPGGNITGLSILTTELGPKQLELLKTMLPTLSRVAVLVNPANPANAAALENLQTAARQIGVLVLPVNARTTEEIERGFSIMTRERADAGFSFADPFFTGQRRRITELASKHRLPLLYAQREYVEAGGLMSYGPDFANLSRRAAVYVDKILKGAKPGELPIEQPLTLHLAINRKTAKALGLAIPAELLLRADEVIE